MAPRMSPRSKSIVSFFLLPLALAGLFSCKGEVHHIEYAYAYGTNWEIHLYEGTKADAEAISDYIRTSSQVLDLDARHCQNGIYALNHQEEIEASPFLIEAIQLGKRIESQSHGAYSISIGALTAAWLENLEQGKILEPILVASYLEQAKATTVTIQGSKAKKEGSGEIDLGSVGKGLCLDHVKAQLTEKGIRKYLINGGSSSLLIGENTSSDGSTKVHLADAKGRYFNAKNIAVSNSAISRQRYEVGGHVYSHIVDARTGTPELAYDALCLAGNGAGLLDGLSTAYLALGKDYANELENQGLQVAFMKGGEVVYESAGFLS